MTAPPLVGCVVWSIYWPFYWHFFSAVGKQSVCNLFSSDQTRWFWSCLSLEIGDFSDFLTHLQTVASQIISSHLFLLSAAILLISSLPVFRCYQKGCSCTASCLSHICSPILQIDQECSSFYIPCYMFPRCDTCGFDKPLVVPYIRVNFPNKHINVCCVSTSVFFPHIKSSSECSRSRHTHMIYSDTGDRG